MQSQTVLIKMCTWHSQSSSLVIWRKAFFKNYWKKLEIGTYSQPVDCDANLL